MRWPACPCPPRSRARSLVPSFFSAGAGPAPRWPTAETFYPRYHYGWSDLRSVQDGRYKLILAPVPELYDLERDPDEEKNLVYLEKKVFEDLLGQGPDPHGRGRDRGAHEVDLGKVDEETREKLAALGYIGSFTDPSKLQGQKLLRPQGQDRRLQPSSPSPGRSGMNGKLDEAVRIDRGDHRLPTPTISDAYFSVGNVLYKARRFEEAIEAFQQVSGAQARRLPSRSSTSPTVLRRPWSRYDDGGSMSSWTTWPGASRTPSSYFLLGQPQGPPRPARQGHPLFREDPGGESASPRRPTTRWRRSTSAATAERGPGPRGGAPRRGHPAISSTVYERPLQPWPRSARSGAGWPRPPTLYRQEVQDIAQELQGALQPVPCLPADGARGRGI
ncbi:MAG: hypothetical protein MZU79_04090 [Anaerotruncus sp.]|nr:hypothetical protein [Anaerotruncus sp.]